VHAHALLQNQKRCSIALFCQKKHINIAKWAILKIAKRAILKIAERAILICFFGQKERSHFILPSSPVNVAHLLVCMRWYDEISIIIPGQIFEFQA
jgi:hypothetical protein